MTEQDIIARTQYTDRVARRLRFLQTLKDVGLSLYLPTDEKARRRCYEQLARLTARQRELPLLEQDDLQRAADAFQQHIDSMQSQLPHDVQYKNRLRRNW